MTDRQTIEAAILNGERYEDFVLKYPDVKKTRYRDVTYLLKKKGLLAPINKEGIKTLTIEQKKEEELKKLRAQTALYKNTIISLHESIENIENSFQNLPKYKINPPAIHKGNKTPSTLVLPLFDLHVGSLVNNSLNHCDISIFENRCNTLCEDLISEIHALKQTRNLEKLIIIFGGDLLEGRTIYTGQVHHSVPIHDQLTLGPEILYRNLLVPLSKHFPNINSLSLPGNHGRIGNKGEWTKVEDNLDMIFCHILRLRTKDIRHMQWLDTKDWFYYFTLYGKKYFTAHGDGFKAGGVSPIQGATKYKNTIQSAINDSIDVCIFGHLHTPATWSQGHSKLMVCGNWVGTTEYSSNFGGGPPIQKAFISDTHAPMSIVYQFPLGRKEKHPCLTPITL